MNLRIADSAELVAYLHEVISLSGVEVLSADGYHVVDVRGRLFYHRPDPITVGGPFPSLGALARSEGVRRHHVAGDRPMTRPASRSSSGRVGTSASRTGGIATSACLRACPKRPALRKWTRRRGASLAQAGRARAVGTTKRPDHE
jgi:hypothetical protein